MKKVILFLLVLSLVFSTLSGQVFAGGDQNVGETGIGETNIDNRQGNQDGVIW